MTNDKDLTCDDSQQQSPFQVVLIDIQKAAKGEIFCVKKSLAKELKYVAISYRWGELHEVNVDTRVGYVASITSFDLDDFYQLCATMTKEPNLRSMDYVWVDTICVNQSNYDERKATIYHMSDIYEQASWIIAVPDLHEAHLRTMTNHKQVMESIQQHRSYLYHLIHRNTKELRSMDASFLDSIDVPQDPGLRQLLTNYTRYFADYFTADDLSTYCIEGVQAIAHLFASHQHSFTNDKYEQVHSPLTSATNQVLDEIQSLHQCNDGEDCPFKNRQYTFDQQQMNGEWLLRMAICITERGRLIRQAMNFLKDLFVDWSSRVWVISEFHIAKKKNNLKFWFYQLDGLDNEKRPSNRDKKLQDREHYECFGSPDIFYLPQNSASLPGREPNALTIFQFDMDQLPSQRPEYSRGQPFQLDIFVLMSPKPISIYTTFYDHLINQLNSQTFPEMMLKSKASKNEDRFYSIFPLFPYYKDLLQTQTNLVTNVNNILSVKLKLYQLMTDEHKLLLFYLSAQGRATYILPTFATSLIEWDDPEHINYLARHSTRTDLDIVLFQDTKIDNSGLYYLRVKSTTYRIGKCEICTDSPAGKTLAQLLHLKSKTLFPKTDDADSLIVDLVWIGHGVKIYFIGSFNENIWILSPKTDYKGNSELKDLPDDFSGFHVY